MSNNNQNSEVIKAKIIAIGGCGANILVDFSNIDNFKIFLIC